MSALPTETRPDITDPVVQDILAAGLREFSQLGFAGARVDAIVASTRTSKRMIYYHFGSKEGLYLAVLDHAFASVRHKDVDVNLDALEPLEALAAYAGLAFDMHAQNPTFVQLVMQENLNGAASMQRSAVIRALNARGLERMERILARGKRSGAMRTDVQAMDLYSNLVGMCFHYVSNRHSFAAIFGHEVDSPDFRAARRRAVIEATLRFV